MDVGLVVDRQLPSATRIHICEGAVAADPVHLVMVALVLPYGMATVGLRELRQDASELVRRVEGGEEIDITVAGRLAARIVPAAPKRWQRWDDIADLFDGRADADWKRDRDLIDQSVTDPWERSR